MLVDELKKPGIRATIAPEINKCTQKTSFFQGALNYKALKFVSNHMHGTILHYLLRTSCT